MLTVSLDNTLWFACFLAEAAVIGLLIHRRAWRSLPVFCMYCVWAMLSDAVAYPILRFSPGSYLTAYLAGTIVDSALEFGVLVELVWSVLRPYWTSLPRRALLAVCLLIVALGAAIWPFAGIAGFGSLPPEWHLLLRLQQTSSILRIVFFLLLAGCSRLLSIGWRNRELQIVTGLGFYSLISLAVAMLHTHQALGPQYVRLNQIVVASYLCSLIYWAVSFSQKEAERQEFTPQMKTLLLTVAGTARAALAPSSVPKLRKPGEP